MSTEEKDSSILSTQDKEGKRLFLFPSIVKGNWYFRRRNFQFVLLLIFLLIPWLSWNDKPIFLFNIPDRRFFLFGLDLWAHDAPLLFFVLGILGFSLFLATAVAGRVWCGWACPQTVFIERVFRQIEIWTEGNHFERIKLNTAPWSFTKIRKKSTKWFFYIVCAWIVSNTFLAYFIGKEELFHRIQSSPYENYTSFLMMLFFFALVLFDFTWFREQFCTIVCPYGRLQSVLMDESSLTVSYDEKRGEPRGKLGKAEGDCIDCKKCVSVCPTGIDIRNGTQMECIACTACIDACDDVMTKIKKPTGLIRYASVDSLNGKPKKIWAPRTIAYVIILGGLIVASVFSIFSKDAVLIQELRHQGAPYQILEREDKQVWIQNIIQLRIHNQDTVEHKIDFRLQDSQFPSEDIELINPISPFPAKAKQSYELSLLVRFKKSKLSEKEIQISIFQDEKFVRNLVIRLLGPSEGS